MPRLSAHINRARIAVAALSFLVTISAPGGPATAAATEAKARAIFLQFVAAQNAHKESAVRAMLWNSSNMPWVSRGIETRGADTVASKSTTKEHGISNPDMSQFHAATITSNVMQILVPIVFTRGLPGKPPQDNTFLIGQTFLREGNSWLVASILPIANTQLK